MFIICRHYSFPSYKLPIYTKPAISSPAIETFESLKLQSPESLKDMKLQKKYATISRLYLFSRIFIKTDPRSPLRLDYSGNLNSIKSKR